MEFNSTVNSFTSIQNHNLTTCNIIATIIMLIMSLLMLIMLINKD